MCRPILTKRPWSNTPETLTWDKNISLGQEVKKVIVCAPASWSTFRAGKTHNARLRRKLIFPGHFQATALLLIQGTFGPRVNVPKSLCPILFQGIIKSFCKGSNAGNAGCF